MAGRCNFEMECTGRKIKQMNERNNQGVRVAINHVSKDFPVDNGRMNVLNDIDM